MSKWIKIATVDAHCFGSFGPYIPRSSQSPHDLTIRRILVRRERKRWMGKQRWVVWGIPEEVVDTSN